MSCHLTLESVTAVVLAGGLGTRVAHLLPGIPKPMAPVAGRPFLDWVVRYLARQGVRRMVLSTGFLADSVERHFAAQPVEGVAIRCIAEPRPLGTAGGFRHAARQVTPRPPAWLVLNGDSLALAALAGLFAGLSDPAVEGGLLGVSMPDASRYGTLEFDADGALRRFLEKRPGAGVINAGVYLLRDSLVQTFPERDPLSFETDVFPACLARRGVMRVEVVEAHFLDIGTPDSLPQAENFIRRNPGWFAA